MNKNYFLFVAFLLFFASDVQSQKKQQVSGAVKEIQVSKTNPFSKNNHSQHAREFAPSGVVRCYTTEHHREMQQNGLAAPDDVFENWIAPKIQELRSARLANPNQTHAVITIPVVVHVIHDGDAVGSGENIADLQVLSQIQVMNEDFRRIAGTPGFGPGVDVEIEFCMAQTDPNGNPTNGINRVNLGQASYTMTQVNSNVKPTTQWNPNEYLNMWSVRFGGGDAGILGYAQFPDASGLAGLNATGGAANTDGVVMAFTAFGSSDIYPAGVYGAPYDKGRTTTHEVGHWLGLRHIWGDGGCSVDDFCADTPAAAGPNYGCPTGADSCAGGGPDQIENYMDYTDDACMDRFTQNQKDRMLVVMANSPRRASLASSTKCLAPAPFIQFGNPTGSIIEQSNCNFSDYNFPINILRPASANAVVSFVVTGGTATQGVDYAIVNSSVTFPAGNMTTQNLTIRVFNDGLVEPNETIQIGLSLNANGGDAVLNASASSMTITITNDDLAPVSTQVVNLLSEDFEDLTGWLVLDGDGDGNNWGAVNGLNGFGTAPNTITGRAGYSAKRLNYFGTNSTVNPNNYLISPQISIPAGATNVDLSFIVGAYDDGGPVRNAGDLIVYFTTDITNQTTIQNGTIVQAALVINENTTQLRTYNLNALAGQTGYLVFRHNNATANNVGLLLIDTVLFNATVNTNVQTEVNNSTRYTATLPSSGTLFASDVSTNRIMASINATSNFNYGCTEVEVNRSNTSQGAATAPFIATNVQNHILSKTFYVTTANDTPSGSYTISMYFSEAEVAAWEAATGKSRTELRIIKAIDTPISLINATNFTSYTVEEIPVTIGAFGSNVVFSATFNSNLRGGYAVGPATGIICGDIATTWNGSTWSNGTPSKVHAVTFNGDFSSSSDVEACSVSITNNAVVTINPTHTFDVIGSVNIANGSVLNIEQNGALKQTDDAAINSGNAVVKRDSSPMIRLDYTAWSSPVIGQQLLAFSPNTVVTRFYEYLFTGTTTPTAYQSVDPSTNFVSGKGYMIRAADNASSTVAASHGGVFNGVPVNGVVNQSVGLGYNLLGNPYPSPIDANRFLMANSSIGTLYFWTNTTPASGGSYPQNNFAAYTTLGGTAAFASATIPNGRIQTGQGFYVLTSSAGAVTFTNDLREKSVVSSQFFRSSEIELTETIEKHRIWLNLNDENTSYNQILVGYMEGATNGVDNMIDGKLLESEKPLLYNLVNNEKYVIQGRALPFTDEDVIPLGLKILTSGNYSISIEVFDGLFASQDIFLKDNTSNVIHDLKQSAYTFGSSEGIFENRFEIVFKNSTLSNEDFINSGDLIVYTTNNAITINAPESIKQVKVFDLLGRKLFNDASFKEKSASINSILPANQALFVKVELINGQIITKKIVF
ncbi:choice-of-anchor J domain-containing protein [Flavobacterium tibetense]|uniref:Zinc metalloprotease n=1 Tax=Flavobacterium tibetense TaxID=2233533 RepID=A0A365P3D3_9FLAO|nr:choice-of-anchor J domain-containing protein [Flavobacterium tibetense]RBA29061.1 hypothetical protein DPN68_04680 [Flavobacterium tibetense]